MVLSTTVFDKTGFLQGWHDKTAGSIELDVRAGVDPDRREWIKGWISGPKSNP